MPKGADVRLDHRCAPARHLTTLLALILHTHDLLLQERAELLHDLGDIAQPVLEIFTQALIEVIVGDGLARGIHGLVPDVANHVSKHLGRSACASDGISHRGQGLGDCIRPTPAGIQVVEALHGPDVGDVQPFVGGGFLLRRHERGQRILIATAVKLAELGRYTLLLSDHDPGFSVAPLRCTIWVHELFTAGAVLLRDTLVDALDVEGALAALKRARSPESELRVDRENLLRILRLGADLDQLLVGQEFLQAGQVMLLERGIGQMHVSRPHSSRDRAQLEPAVVLQTPEEG